MLKCELTKKEMKTVLKGQVKRMKQLFSNGAYKGYDDVIKMVTEK